MLNDLINNILYINGTTIIRRSEQYKYNSDIDVLTLNLGEVEKFLINEGFYRVEYLGKHSGFFMRKLTYLGVITFHLQKDVFFVDKSKNVLYLVDGFSDLILNSNENYDYVLYMMKIVYEKVIKDKYYNVIKEKYNRDISEIDLNLEIEKFLKFNNLKIIKKGVKFFMVLKKIRRVKVLFYKRTIAIIGIDGTGKSTIVDSLSHILGHNSSVIYMGKKDWKLKLSEYFLSKKRLPSIFNILILYFEFIYRYSAIYKSSKVFIFDRYVTDMYLTQYGVRKVVYYLLFNIFFPKPNYRFYLKCDFNTSLKRKDDINDIVDFKNRKLLFDNCYKGLYQIDTDLNNKEEVLKTIIDNLDPKIVKIL